MRAGRFDHACCCDFVLLNGETYGRRRRCTPFSGESPSPGQIAARQARRGSLRSRTVGAIRLDTATVESARSTHSRSLSTRRHLRRKAKKSPGLHARRWPDSDDGSLSAGGKTTTISASEIPACVDHVWATIRRGLPISRLLQGHTPLPLRGAGHLLDLDHTATRRDEREVSTAMSIIHGNRP